MPTSFSYRSSWASVVRGKILRFSEQVGGLTRATFQVLRCAFHPPFMFSEVRKHMDELGARSLPLVGTTGVIMGLILAVQSRPVLARFGADLYVPALVSVSVIRELGPVITALIVAGRVSSGIGAELGSMRVTEQIDAMEVSGVDPFRFLVVTRVIACTLMLPLRKRMGFVFQGSALYDSMSVHDNLAFPLRRTTSLPEHEIERRVVDGLERVGLRKFIDTMPAELSGGMRKRVGLARSLITRPEFLLYDEPTTGLDPVTASEISSLILDLEKQFDTTSIAVTHDLACARTIADKVAILNDGVIRHEGSIEELEHVDDPFVRSFFAYR